MQRPRVLQGIGAVLLAGALATAPLGVAGAKTHHKPTHHTSAPKKGANPGSTLCKDLRAEETTAGKIGSSIATALESGNFVSAKQEMVAAINEGLRAAAPALSVLSSAPGNVQERDQGAPQVRRPVQGGHREGLQPEQPRVFPDRTDQFAAQVGIHHRGELRHRTVRHVDPLVDQHHPGVDVIA